MEQGSCEIKNIALTKTVATKMIDAGGKRNTATKAARGSD